MDNILHLINAYGDPDIEGFAERQFRIETYAKTLAECGYDLDTDPTFLREEMGLNDLTSDEITTINSYLNWKGE